MTYREALMKAREMVNNGECESYACDGHSWVMVRYENSSEFLYDGESTIL